jgi:hypothetical protein
MKAKNLLVLIAALAVLFAVSKLVHRKPSASAGAAENKVLTFDLNEIGSFTLTAGTQSVTVAKIQGKWAVKSLWDYPANFDTVVDQLRQLADLKGAAIRGSESQLEEFGLTASNTDYLAIGFDAASGGSLGRIELGAPRLASAEGGMGGYPNGQYVRAGEGPVLLVNEYLSGIPRRAEDWANKELLNVNRSSISYLMVLNPEAPAYGLVADTNAMWKLNELAENEETKQDTAGSVAGALSYLNFITVANPAASPESAGLDKPSVFVAKTTNGVVYTINAGAKLESAGGRYATIGVAYEGSDTNESAKVAGENARVSKWVYVLTESTCANLTMSRDQLVSVRTNTVETTSTTNPPPAAPTPAN